MFIQDISNSSSTRENNVLTVTSWLKLYLFIDWDKLYVNYQNNVKIAGDEISPHLVVVIQQFVIAGSN